VLHEPRHLGDAFRRRARQRARHTLRALPLRGRRTGAADGYAEWREASGDLLHLGPGLGNGIANLHNARRARSPIVNIVGDHATYHLQHDAPLTSDIEGLARAVSALGAHDTTTPPSVGVDAAEAIACGGRAAGRIATLILPADAAWTEGGKLPARRRSRRRSRFRGGDRRGGAGPARRQGDDADARRHGAAPGRARLGRRDRRQDEAPG